MTSQNSLHLYQLVDGVDKLFATYIHVHVQLFGLLNQEVLKHKDLHDDFTSCSDVMT